jgi:hypothetical protein
MFGFFFNLVETAQEINLYTYLNANKPLNLENLLQFFINFRFHEHISLFKKIRTTPTNKNKTKARLFTSSDQIPPPLFEIKGFSSSFLSNGSSVLLIVILSPLGIFLILKLTDRILARRNRNKTLSLEEENYNY